MAWGRGSPEYQENELELVIMNTRPLYQRLMVWKDAFVKKKKAGKYNPTKAVTGLVYVVDEAIRYTNRERGRYDEMSLGKVPMVVKRKVAKTLLNYITVEYLRNVRKVTKKKKTARKTARRR
jgi:hypothetical protein